MRRRTFIALAAGALTSACAAAPGARPGQTVLRFWSWVPGIDQAVNLWNSQNRDTYVDLELTPAGSSGTYSKMYAAVRGGRGAPDVAQVEYQELPGFALENGLIELGPLGMDQHRDQFVDWQISQSSFGERIYAVPQASGPMALYYRNDIFGSLGLDVPRTWEDYRAAAEAVRADGRYIATFPPGNSAWFAALSWQAGARWFGLDGDVWTVGINSEQTLRVAEYWDELRSQDLISMQPDFSNSWYADLQSGRIVTWPSAQWGGPILSGNAPGTSGNWRAAQLPQWNPDNPASANWGGSATAVLKGSEHPREAAEFAIWLNSDPESIDLLIAGGYGWPSVKDALDGTALDTSEEFFGGQNVNRDVFAPADETIGTDWLWSPTTNATYLHLNDGFAGVVAGGSSFVDVVQQTHRQTVEDLRAKGLTVREAS
ncbi:ABC transporter substrate-binding protein [Kineosporia babensis]|uniref:Extracellular solute-binding protein n=1 Tax=Kineosporia babensis TaxID=499548 RepID=A0A9X1NIZ7_9ACTN|nr:extracellular solute-binding protein [Kineosporia babensis]MCD5314076.1 extracellular solute-binding protein [Kineosporia babensis]